MQGYEHDQDLKRMFFYILGTFDEVPMLNHYVEKIRNIILLLVGGTRPPHLHSEVHLCKKKTKYEYQVPGTKDLVPSTWYQVLGTKYLVPSTWYQVPGTK